MKKTAISVNRKNEPVRLLTYQKVAPIRQLKLGSIIRLNEANYPCFIAMSSKSILVNQNIFKLLFAALPA
ncbi:MAG: hypothetical protein PHO83_17580 [Geobacteraceae bacterium]|nr:hypothetical protein [Geobacteraceae bacterium]